MSVSVENLSVAYRSRRGDVTAVDSVSFTLADGEIMGLAGESGSGKSTLGNALIYLDRQDEADRRQGHPGRQGTADRGQ